MVESHCHSSILFESCELPLLASNPPPSSYGRSTKGFALGGEGKAQWDAAGQQSGGRHYPIWSG